MTGAMTVGHTGNAALTSLRVLPAGADAQEGCLGEGGRRKQAENQSSGWTLRSHHAHLSWILQVGLETHSAHPPLSLLQKKKICEIKLHTSQHSVKYERIWPQKPKGSTRDKYHVGAKLPLKIATSWSTSQPGFLSSQNRSLFSIYIAD